MQSSTQRLPIRALFGFMLKLVRSYPSPSPQSLGVVVCPWCQPWVASLNAIFCIENWPAFSDAARGGLDSIRQTHRVIPIPAYDVEGKLIDPHYHCRHLEGALAEVHFNLTHWSISRQGVPGKDVYTADIALIRVLVPPRAAATPCTPLKRKVSAFIHPDCSPTKRART